MSFFSTVAFALKRTIVIPSFQTREDQVRNSWEYFHLQQSIKHNPCAKTHMLVVTRADNLSDATKVVLKVDGLFISRQWVENDCVIDIDEDGEFIRGKKLFVEVNC